MIVLFCVCHRCCRRQQKPAAPPQGTVHLPAGTAVHPPYSSRTTNPQVQDGFNASRSSMNPSHARIACKVWKCSLCKGHERPIRGVAVYETQASLGWGTLCALPSRDDRQQCTYTWKLRFQSLEQHVCTRSTRFERRLGKQA